MSRLVPLLVALLLSARAATAQPEIGLDVGVAVPTGSLASARSIGPSAALSVGFGNGGRGVGTRADLMWQRMFGQSPPPDRGTQLYEDYSAYSARGSVVFTFNDRRSPAYGLLGVGAYHLAVQGDSNPYGLIPGAHVGLGVRVLTGPVAFNVEVQAVVLLTDYGARSFDWPVTYVPVSVGVRF